MKHWGLGLGTLAEFGEQRWRCTRESTFASRARRMAV